MLSIRAPRIPGLGGKTRAKKYRAQLKNIFIPDDFCTEPPTPPSGSMLRLINWGGSPLQHNLANFTYACTESMVMTGQPDGKQIFDLPCPYSLPISWPTCKYGED